jgi:hypothetical protein
MGRYYEGDIEGKFAFGDQESSAADRFGVTGQVPEYLDYYYDETNLPGLESELKAMEKEFGEYRTPLLSYFDLFDISDNTRLHFRDYLEKGGLQTMSSEQWHEYNDYLIGRKILKSIKDKGDCSFTAEL